MYTFPQKAQPDTLSVIPACKFAKTLDTWAGRRVYCVGSTKYALSFWQQMQVINMKSLPVMGLTAAYQPLVPMSDFAQKGAPLYRSQKTRKQST
jgi:hypothetical protein